MTALMSAARQLWTQISLHAVKSDPRCKSTSLPPIQYPQLKHQRPACHFELTQEEGPRLSLSDQLIMTFFATMMARMTPAL